MDFSLYEALTKNLIISDTGKKGENVVYVDYSSSSNIDIEKFLIGKIFKIYNIIESNSIITIPSNAALYKLFENPEEGSILSWFFQTEVFPITLVGEMGDIEINTNCSLLYLVLDSINPIMLSMYTTPISVAPIEEIKEDKSVVIKKKINYNTINASNFLVNTITILDSKEVEFSLEEYSNFNHIEIIIFGQGKDNCTLGISFNDKEDNDKKNYSLLGKLNEESTLLQTFIPCYRDSNFSKVVKTGEISSCSNTFDPITKLKIFPLSGEILNGTRIYLYIRL